MSPLRTEGPARSGGGEAVKYEPHELFNAGYITYLGIEHVAEALAAARREGAAEAKKGAAWADGNRDAALDLCKTLKAERDSALARLALHENLYEMVGRVLDQLSHDEKCGVRRPVWIANTMKEAFEAIRADSSPPKPVSTVLDEDLSDEAAKKAMAVITGSSAKPISCSEHPLVSMPGCPACAAEDATPAKSEPDPSCTAHILEKRGKSGLEVWGCLCGYSNFTVVCTKCNALRPARAER